MKRVRSTARKSPARGASPAASPASSGGRRVLLIEPDHLTLWSVATYLQRWFTVVTTNCSVEAEKLLRDSAVAAVIISDQFPRRAAETLTQLTRRLHPAARTVLMVTGEAEADGDAEHATRLEKPFELSVLARLLGVPDGNVAS